MGDLAWLPAAARAAGLDVWESPGWLTRRTRDGFYPRGVVCHHTATSKSWADGHVYFLLRDGRTDLAGPLAQIGLERDGTVVLIAAGRCNHNGYGLWGNDSVGIEAYNDGRGEPWPAVQLDAYERLVAVICGHYRWGPDRVLAHRETDPTRKIDPTGIDMDAFRADVFDRSEEADVNADQDARLKRIESRLNALVPDLPRPVDVHTGQLDADGTPAALVWRWNRQVVTTVPVLLAEVAALKEAVSQLGAGGNIDYGKVQEAAGAALKETLGALDGG